MNRLFITGMGRSGTTLLDKLLSNHNKIEILSQPFPLFFIELKKTFLKSIGIAQYYVLNGNAYDGDYDIDEFNKFIYSKKVNYKELQQIFKNMEKYSGQMTKVICNIPYMEEYSFLKIYDLIIQNNLLKQNVCYFGAKEIMCEEFMPYFLQNNTKTIIIVRDPRDVVSSINYPKKEKYLGEKKPTLFILRNWRRTIDYIKMFKDSDNLMYIKYENLVNKPYETLNSITNFLGIEPFDNNHFDNGIYDRDEKLWKANTSFDTQTSFITSKSVGGYKNTLSKEEISYIETVCIKEMKWLGYELITTTNKEIIKTFKDYKIANSKYLKTRYTSLPENIKKELVRYTNYIQGNIDEKN